MKQKMTRKEKQAKQTDQVLNKLTERINSTGLLPWQVPWVGKDSTLRPFNVVSGREYNGSNVILLHLVSFGKIPAFSPATKEHKPKKGSKATYIIKPFSFKTEDKKTGEDKVITLFNLMPVFHYTDLQGIDCEVVEAKYAPKPTENPLDFNPIPACEAVVNEMPNAPKMDNEGGNRAFYRPSTDSISLPKKDTFDSEVAYYQTLFHEMAHSTGHFTRLDRFKKNNEEFTSHDHSYGFEELVAELTACFLGSETGSMTDKELNNSASYLKGWISKLQSNPDWIIKASSLANKASQYILNKTPQQQQEA